MARHGPLDIARRYAAGEITKTECIDTLAAWPYEKAHGSPEGVYSDYLSRGDKRDLGIALANGYIEDDVYDEVVRRLGDAYEWTEHLGGVYSAAGVARILGGPGGPVTNQEVAERRDLLVLRTGSGQVAYPKIQFAEDGQPLAGIAEVVSTLPSSLVSPWTVASWLASGKIPGQDLPPVELLKVGVVAPVVAAAREWASALAQ